MTLTRFPSGDLVASDGQIYAHIFENSKAGVSRGLFWSVSIHFRPLQYGGEQQSCSMTCEWIPWTIRDWRELDHKHLDAAYGDDGTESSFYMMEHHLGTHTRLRLAQRPDGQFNVRMEMAVDFEGYLGGDEERAMQIAGSVDVPFTGVLVVPDNLEPKPSGIDEIKNVSARFIDLSCYLEPQRQGHAYVFKPTL